MGWLVLVAVVVVLLALLAAFLKSRGSTSTDSPYLKTPALFSPAERSFLGVLDQAVGDTYRVFGKVRVADVVSVRSLSDRSAWQRAFNKINAKHFDFVLCSTSDLSVVAAIELDDKSHQNSKRQARDRFLVELCSAVSLPLIQVPAKHTYTVAELRNRVDAALMVDQQLAAAVAVDEARTPEPKAPDSVEPEREGIEEQSQPEAAMAEPPCPKCSAPMVRRETKSGANAGQPFWGCSTFPKCRGIIKVNP